MPDDRLVAKTEQYREMLEQAIEAAEPAESAEPATSGDETVGEDGCATGRELIGMARNYLQDGQHYEREGDHVTALASYSYGHGWLDAGVRSGVIEADDPELFVVDG